MIINSHVHISIFEDNANNLKGAFALLKKDMTDNQIEYAIVIPDNIENSLDVADLEMAQKLINNDNKFYLLGSPQIVQRGSSETDKYEELIHNRTIKGIKFFPGHDPYYPTDERCLPYYSMCKKHNVPIVIHTGENSGDSECAKYNDPKYIVEMANQLEFKDNAIYKKIKEEIKRFNMMASAISGGDAKSKSKIQEKGADIKAYVKYILEHGKIEEKREILGNLSNDLILKDKKLSMS